MKFFCETTVSHQHLALAGHFPGNPVVPGVVILQLVQDCIQQSRKDATIRSLSKVKFHSPLLPGQQVTIICEGNETQFHFRCHHSDEMIVQGTLQLNGDRSL